MVQSINVEVAFALAHKQKIVSLQVEQGTSAEQAVKASAIQRFFPDQQIEGADLGIFGKTVKADHILQEGDRVEIYRALIADPKEVRKRRAAEAKARRAEQKQSAKANTS